MGFSTTGNGARTRRRTVLAATVAAGTLLAACGGDEGAGGAGGDGDSDVVTGAVTFEATGQFLSAAGERSAGEPYRYEMSMGMTVSGGGPGEHIEFEAPYVNGEQDGEAYEMHMDMGTLMEEMMSAMGGTEDGLPGDLTMDIAGDSQVMYLRAPMYAQLADIAGPRASGTPIGDLAALGDGWGRVDLTAVDGLGFGDLQAGTGSPGATDPRAMLDLVSGADDVEALGADEIRGIGTNGLGATLSMGDLLEAQGMDADEYAEQVTRSMGSAADLGSLGETVTEAMVNAEVPFEVWVDGDGLVRRVSLDIDMATIMGALPLQGGLAMGDDGIEEFSLGTTMDFFDYGAEDIAVEMPADSEVVDVTDAYRGLIEGT